MNIKIERYKSLINEIEELMGAKFVGVEPNPKSRTPSDQYAIFEHSNLKHAKKIQLNKLNDRIRAFKKDGYNIFTANSKHNAMLNGVVDNNVDTAKLQSKDCRQDGLQEKCKLFKPIVKPDSKEQWVVISTKIKQSDKEKLTQLLSNQNMSISQLIKGYVDHIVDSSEK